MRAESESYLTDIGNFPVLLLLLPFCLEISMSSNGTSIDLLGISDRDYKSIKAQELGDYLFQGGAFFFTADPGP